MPFERVAAALSQEPAAELGGMLGYFKRGNLPQELDRAAFDLAAGQISGIVETDRGYHILKVYERKGGKVEPFEDVNERVLEVLIQKKRSDRLNRLLQGLRENAQVERLIN